MIILEHDHAAQIVSVGIDTPNHHPVLFHKPESRCRLSCSSYRTFPTALPGCISESTRSDISIYHLRSYKALAYTEAIPLHLARVLSATRSPKSSCLAFPRTMATLVLVLGGTTDPSGSNHSTLFVSSHHRPERTSSQHKQRSHQRMEHQLECPIISFTRP
jgi:hypothetical protein